MEGPLSGTLTGSCAVKLKGIDSWVYISHLRKDPTLDWSTERTPVLKLTLKQCLCEVSKNEKERYHMILLLCGI